MIIRLAEINDIREICELYNQFFAYNASQQPQYYKKAIEAGYYPESVMESDAEDIYVAADEKGIAGLIHIAEEKTPPYDCFVQYRYAAIIDLFVAKDFRNTGVGGMLLESAKQWAKARGLAYIELNVLAENENGIQFYHHKDFQTVSQIMRYAL